MRRITHIDGVPVRRPFYTYPAMTAHEVKQPGRLSRLARAAWRTARGCVEFVSVYSQYRRTHPSAYAARIARDIAFRGLPF